MARESGNGWRSPRLVTAQRIGLGSAPKRGCLGGYWQLSTHNGPSRMSTFGPECVKTLSYRACFSPLLLGVAISRLFTSISAGNASVRV